MTFDQAKNIFEDIVASAGCEVFKESLFNKAIEYSAIRSKWYLQMPDERRAADQRRTIAHNAFIDTCNVLSRNMAKAGEDNSWRAALGDDRKVIGDFACYVALFLALEAR